MCFTWMTYRLAYSKSPTKYASAASCRVKMVCTWKHILYHPTSRAISQTRCEKSNLQMRGSVLFWNQQISQRATIPGQYLWGLFTFLALRNSFQGALPPMVSWSLLLPGSSPPNVDGPASAAIWANCQVSDDSGDLPTSSNFSASALLLSISFGVEGPTHQALEVPLGLVVPLIQHAPLPIFLLVGSSCPPPSWMSFSSLCNVKCKCKEIVCNKVVSLLTSGSCYLSENRQRFLLVAVVYSNYCSTSSYVQVLKNWRYKIHTAYLYTEISLKLPNRLFLPNCIVQC